MSLGRREQRPAPGVLHPEGDGAAPSAPPRDQLALAGGNQQRPQPGETVGGRQTQRHQFGQRLLDLGAQQPGAGDQFIEERRAMLADESGDRLRRRGSSSRRLGVLDKRPPKRRMPAGEQRDRRGAHRADAPRAAVRAAGSRGLSRAQATRPGKALVVQPGAFVVGHPRGKDFALPGARRRLEAFELRDRRRQRFRTLPPRLGAHVLPGEQEAQEVARGDGLDLGAQALERVVVNAGEQPPVAPFLAVRAGREATAHGEPFDLQRRERGGDLAGLQARAAPRERSARPAPALRAVRAGSRPARPLAIRRGLGACGRRRRTRVGPQRLKLRQPFGGDPDVARRRRASRVTRFSAGKRVQPFAPIRRLVGR